MAAHAYDTATLLNEIDPDYLGLLTLMVCQGHTTGQTGRKRKVEVPRRWRSCMKSG